MRFLQNGSKDFSEAKRIDFSEAKRIDFSEAKVAEPDF